MEPDWAKRIGIVGIVIISVVLGVFLWRDRREGQERSDQIQAYKDARYPLERQIRELEEEMEKVKQDYEAMKGNGDRLVALVVTQTGTDLYQTAFPLFREYDVAGTFVVDPENLPGEEGQISVAEYQELLDAGWEAALGGTLGEDMAAWQEKLEEDLSAWNGFSEQAPASYVFLDSVESQDQDACREILKKRGFTTVTFPEENERIAKRTFQEGELAGVGSTSYYEDTSYVKEFLGSLPGGAMAAVTVRSIGEEITDLRLDCSESKYRRLLEYLHEQSGTVKMVTLSGIPQSKEKALEEAKDREEEYSQALEELEKEKEACQEKLDEITFPDLL